MDPRVLSEANLEVWRTIPGFPKYEVSNLGRVRGGRLNCLLKPRPKVSKTKTYIGFALMDGRGRKDVLLHRIMLLAFDGPPQRGQVGRHLDDNEAHNKLHNLKWGTHLDNAADAKRNGKARTGNKGEASPQSKLLDIQVEEIKCRLLAKESQRLLASEFGVNQATISRINTGLTRGDV